MSKETEKIYERRHYLINQYDPAKTKIQAKELQRQYLEQELEQRSSISTSLAKRRAEWSAKPSPYHADQLNLIMYKRKPKLPEADWNPCLQVASSEERRQQMLHDETLYLESHISNAEQRPKSQSLLNASARGFSPRFSRTEGSRTPNRQQITLGHNLITPELRPKTGLAERMPFHDGKIYEHLID